MTLTTASLSSTKRGMFSARLSVDLTLSCAIAEQVNLPSQFDRPPEMDDLLNMVAAKAKSSWEQVAVQLKISLGGLTCSAIAHDNVKSTDNLAENIPLFVLERLAVVNVTIVVELIFGSVAIRKLQSL